MTMANYLSHGWLGMFWFYLLLEHSGGWHVWFGMTHDGIRMAFPGVYFSSEHCVQSIVFANDDFFL